MHRNYYIFERQVSDLDQMLNGGRICGCFSHRKDELVLEIEQQEIFHLRLGIDAHSPYLLQSDNYNIKDPKIQFFPEILDQKISQISIEPFDKTIYISLTGFRILASFYGHDANVHLYDESGNLIKSFKKRIPARVTEKEHAQIDPRNFSGIIQSDLAEHKHLPALEKYLFIRVGGFNKLLAREACFRAGLNTEQKLSEITQTGQEKLARSVRAVHAEILSSAPRILILKDGSVILSLLELKQLTTISDSREFETLNQAWTDFLYRSRQSGKVQQLRSAMLGALKKKTDYLERTLQKIRDVEELEIRKRESELKGHLLQTFSHQIPKGAASVKLKNIFSEDQEEVTIKLNPARTVQENARKYFEKFKNISEQRMQISVKKDTFENELEQWKSLQVKIQDSRSLKELEKFYHELTDKNLIQSRSDKAPDRQNLAYAFNRLLLERKWEVFIGKNAANNDLLTFQFARKFDLWFHAQGVPGSHVIVRLHERNNYPPMSIIEQVAGIAAYNSGARHSSTVPVNYTEVRFVRKFRKSAPGAVVISNEKTIFTKPVKYF